MEDTYLFYTYSLVGNDIIVAITADSKDAAWTKFNHLHGEDTPVDFVMRKTQND